jgi:putative ABC transport system substrate-binding protein
LKKLAPTYNFEIVEQGVQTSADIPQAATSLVNKVDCINNFTDNNVVNNLTTVLEKANEAGIPVYGSEIEQVKKGCLASESLDYVALGEQTGAMAARALEGADAAKMAVELVKDSFPVINTDVAAKFNITIPEAYASIEKVTTSAQ